MKCVAIILLLVIKVKCQPVFIDAPVFTFEPCLKPDIQSTYIYGAAPIGEENQYRLTFKRNIDAGTKIVMKFDSAVSIEVDLAVPNVIEISKSEKIVRISFNKNYFGFNVIVKGLVNGNVPYLTSLLINEVENCRAYTTGYLNNIVKDLRLSRQVKSSLTNKNCGRRKLDFTALIIEGEFARPGEWPWHAAIYRRQGITNSYICGGTLISKLFVLTAAHCVTKNKAALVPDVLSTVLGKHYLTGSDVTRQEREVFSVIVHEEFRLPRHSDNDIALLKLMTEAVYNDYVQPACIWTSDTFKQSTNDLIGTVVGWGNTETDKTSLALELKAASLPIISELKCIKREPAFYGELLSNERKFCAGWDNGTSPCNGDSGGGFMVSIPDDSSTTSIWYVRGIVSVIKTIAKKCDPNQYAVFTDTSKYETWIRVKTHDVI